MSNNNFSIEYLDHKTPFPCACCNGNSYRLTRLVSINETAHAVVFIDFTDNHPDYFLKIAVSVGEWWMEISKNRVCFTIWFKATADGMGFMLREPSDCDWSNDSILGQHLSAEEAINHPQINDVWEILDKIIIEDKVLRTYFDS